MKNTGMNSVAFFETMVKKGELNQQDLLDIKEGKKQLQTEELFIRKILTGTAGVVEVINENDVTKNCITNLSKGSVPADKNIIVTKIGLRFGWTAAAADAAAVNYTNAIYDIADVQADAGANVVAGASVYARRIPVQIQNSEYELVVDGIVMDKGRTSELLTQNVAVDATNGSSKNFRELEWPKLFRADKRVQLNLKFPENGAAVPAGTYYVELVVKGLGLAKRAA